MRPPNASALASMVALMAVLGLLACGGPAAGPREPTPLERLDADECPASFGEASGACDEAGGVCEFPEGSCVCRSASYCGGVDPGPDYEPPAPTWHCDYGPGTTRPDGCPGQLPDEGAACPQEGQRCSYGSCCMHPATCVGGVWEVGGANCPP